VIFLFFSRYRTKGRAIGAMMRLSIVCNVMYCG